jgi:hypothetical protein
MKKYRLIKEYPGSPELGIEVEKESNSKSSSSYFYRSGDKRICVFNDHVEDNPEYWQEVSCTYYLVHTEMKSILKNWEPIEVNEKIIYNDSVMYFETKQQAEKFIIMNKPCLTLLDVSSVLESYNRKRNIFLELRKLVKQKL